VARIVVIGAGAAGMSAASRAKRLKPSNEVIVFDSSRWVSFALCGIPYYIGGEVSELEDLLYCPRPGGGRGRRADLSCGLVARGETQGNR